MVYGKNLKNRAFQLALRQEHSALKANQALKISHSCLFFRIPTWLLALSLSFFSQSLVADEIPLAENLYKTNLPNQVSVYIQESPPSTVWGSFNVVFKYASLGHVLYTFDSKQAEWDAVKEFFSVCLEKANGKQNLAIPYGNYFCSTLHSQLPQEMAVIAVGDFQTSEMLKLIEEQFAAVQLDEKSVPAPVFINYTDGLHHSQVALTVALPTPYGLISNTEQLKECWKNILLQDLLQQRFEESIRGLNEIWVHPHPQNFYPVTGFALVSEEEAENALAFLLWHLEMLQHQGFYADSFHLKKRQTLHKLLQLSAQSSQPSNSMLSSYYKDQFLLGSYNYSQEHFLLASIAAVQEIEFEDLLPLLDAFIDGQNHQVQIAYSTTFRHPPLTLQGIEKLKSQVKHLAHLYLGDEDPSDASYYGYDDDHYLLKTNLEAKDFIQCSNQSIQPEFCLSNDAVQSFYQLPLSAKEKELIESIISTMAQDNLLQLAFNRKSIEKKGKKIEHVHPLRFMGYILSRPSLKSDVRVIKKSSFKWDAFIDGFSKRMKEELGKNNIYPHIAGFAELIGSTPEDVTYYINKKDWEGLVKSAL